MKSSRRYKQLGCLWFLSPVIFLVAVIVAWEYMESAYRAFFQVSNGGFAMLVGFLVVAFFMWVVLPLGFAFGLRQFGQAQQARREERGEIFDPASGKGAGSVVPPEARKWSWGGFGLGWIWGMYHGIWISLFGIIPFVNFIVMFYLGLKGRELAWKKNKWTSPADFNSFQAEWDMFGVILLMLSIFSFLASLVRFISK